jgi:hypothetical protein
MHDTDSYYGTSTGVPRNMVSGTETQRRAFPSEERELAREQTPPRFFVQARTSTGTCYNPRVLVPVICVHASSD